MNEDKLGKELREYHFFKGVFDILFWRLKHNLKQLDVEWIKNELYILCRIFAEAKRCKDCVDTEVDEEQRKQIHWKTLNKKWERRFETPWKEFLEKWTSRLS